MGGEIQKYVSLIHTEQVEPRKITFIKIILLVKY